MRLCARKTWLSLSGSGLRVLAWASTPPVSMPVSIRNSDQPMPHNSPFTTAQNAECVPRYSGVRPGWKTSIPRGGMDRIFFWTIGINIKMQTSGARLSSSAAVSSELMS